MSSHEWYLGPIEMPDAAVSRGSADNETAARLQAFKEAECLIRTGHVEPFAIVVGDLPVAFLAPAVTVDGKVDADESLGILARIRNDLGVDAR
ncbi:hypothetical protein JNUCC0626_32165 [Lentzea sp. JNUCC 0626]|uniref:hypothetical protein n=1 Tax=Lentzea sp. JNUCC 0626 TaxID=3367513 RepID=UPI003748F9EA